MDKGQKTTELLKLIESCPYANAAKIDDRTYDASGKFIRFHDVSTGGELYGFVAIQIPNPADDFDMQLENLMDILTAEQIVKGCLKSVVIDAQQDARKVALGVVQKMPDAEFAAAWDNLDPEVCGRLKTYEHIRAHIIEDWTNSRVDDTEGLRLF